MAQRIAALIGIIVAVFVGYRAAMMQVPISVDQLQLMPVFGVVVDANGKVIHVEPGGAADNTGVQAGDVFTRIGATAAASGQDAMSSVHREIARQSQERAKAQQAKGPWQPIPVTITRNAVEHALTIVPSPPDFSRLSGTPTPVVGAYRYY